MSYWIEFLEKNAHEYGDKIAVIDQGTNRRLTYHELNAEVDQWAAVLQAHDVRKNDAIAFLNTHNCLEHVTLMLACSKIGAFLCR